MAENRTKPDGADAQDSREANRRWWLTLLAYVVIGSVLGVALSMAVALIYQPISSLPDHRFEIPGIGGPPGAMIGLAVFLFTRKT